MLKKLLYLPMAFCMIGNLTSSISMAEGISREEIHEIAKDAFVYAYPLVLSGKTIAVGTNVENANFPNAPKNQVAHARAFPDETFTIVVRPNADTLYSTLSFDVSAEPLVFEIPNSKGRYYLMAFMDLWSDVFASPGSRTTGTSAQKFAIVGPNWTGELPTGVRQYRSPTNQGILIGRTQTNGKSDYENVHQFQNGIRVMPLSHFGTDYVPPKGVVDQQLPMGDPTMMVEQMSGREFFEEFFELALNNPPHQHDYPILDRMERIGLIPGKKLEFDALPLEVKTALNDVPKIAIGEIKIAWRNSGQYSNGWRTNLTAIGTYGADYIHRAGVAFGALGANVPEDALYPTTFVDSQGNNLHSDNKYVIHFNADQIPPVRAFWSLTMYNDKQTFAPNSIRRFAIGDRDALKFNADGSLDIYIQRDTPQDSKVSNWLPAPSSGEFSMNLRLYWPKTSATSGEWTPPAVQLQKE